MGEKTCMGANKCVMCVPLSGNMHTQGRLLTCANVRVWQPVDTQMCAHVYEQMPKGGVCVCTLRWMHMRRLNMHFCADMGTCGMRTFVHGSGAVFRRVFLC